MAVREITSTIYNSNEHSDENSLAQLRLSEPDKLSRRLTYLWGDDSNQFTFLTMTEAQKGGYKEINDVQYTWDVMGKFQHTQRIVGTTSLVSPGLGRSTFELIFDGNKFPNDWLIMAPDGETLCHIQGMPEKVTGAPNQYRYTLMPTATSNTATVASTNLTVGKSWILIAPAVPESGSRGNYSTRMAPGSWKGQIGFKRYTMKIEGNLANKVVPIVFDGADTTDGKESSYWINEEWRQFEHQMRMANSTDMYTSTYNRDTYGQIFMKYYENDKPIPLSQGIREMISEGGNSDTYGYTLPLAKIKNIVGDVFWGATDSGKMEVIIHCGTGFAEDFDTAVNTEINLRSAMFVALGDKKVSSNGNYLRYGGGYFNQYMTITGHLVTLKVDNMFDDGLLGELDIANGNRHPRTNYPMCSHTGIFVDYSVYKGERNVKMITMKGQSNISGIVKGLAPIPASWGGSGLPTTTGQAFANDKDASSYEVKQSRGINIMNNTHCFELKSVL